MNADYTFMRRGGIGDLLMIMNLLKNFRKKHGEDVRIAFACSPGIAEVMGHFLIDRGFVQVIDTEGGWYGKELPLVGYPIPLRKEIYPHTELGNHPHEPMKKHAIEYFAEELKIEPDFDSFIMPKPKRLIEGDYVTIHPKAGWSPYKNWDYESWNLVVWNLVRKGIKVIQIGSPDDPKLGNCSGFISTGVGENRARVQFESCLNAIAHAKLHMGVDSWTNHATNIQWFGEDGVLKRTKGVILWGSSQCTGTGYPKTNVNISANLPCSPCFREDPKVSSYPLSRCPNPIDQTYGEPKHACMAQIEPKRVYEAVMKELEEGRANER